MSRSGGGAVPSPDTWAGGRFTVAACQRSLPSLRPEPSSPASTFFASLCAVPSAATTTAPLVTFFIGSPSPRRRSSPTSLPHPEIGKPGARRGGRRWWKRPQLTTVGQDVEAKGRAAADALLEVMERGRNGAAGRAERLLLPTHLVVRDSSGPAPPPARRTPPASPRRNPVKDRRPRVAVA